jgi:hypothetical protein
MGCAYVTTVELGMPAAEKLGGACNRENRRCMQQRCCDVEHDRGSITAAIFKTQRAAKWQCSQKRLARKGKVEQEEEGEVQDATGACKREDGRCLRERAVMSSKSEARSPPQCSRHEVLPG